MFFSLFTCPKRFRSKKIVFNGQSDPEKFADFNGTIIFEIRQKMADISLKNLISA